MNTEQNMLGKGGATTESERGKLPHSQVVPGMENHYDSSHVVVVAEAKEVNLDSLAFQSNPIQVGSAVVPLPPINGLEDTAIKPIEIAEQQSRMPNLTQGVKAAPQLPVMPLSQSGANH